MSYLKKTMPGQLALTLALLAFFSLPPLARASEKIAVHAQVESGEVYVGQPFTLQLEINGADAPEQPSIHLDDFKVEARGGTNRSQSYQLSLNGTVQTTKTSSYIYQYLLTATRTGVLTIPAIPVTIKGATYRTAPISLAVKAPVEIDEFKLRVELSKARCYVGEAITMTTTWLIGQDLQGFEFNLPIIGDQRFQLFAKPVSPAQGQKELVELEVAGGKIIAEKKRVQHKGREYISLSFRHTLIPTSPGKVRLPDASLAINAFAGYSQPQRRQFGMDPFDMLGSGRRKMFRTVVIPANAVDLEVLALPSQGRPAQFGGLVGTYTIITEASPTTVKVGDPISLTVSIGGTFVDNLNLPPLEDALPGQDFKTATDRPQSTLATGIKSFTTTIRASHAQVSTIPSLSLAFFNPESQQYEVARSAPIDLTVQATRVVTAADALGTSEMKASASSPADMGSEARQDIQANYEEIDVARPSNNDTLLAAALLLLGPLLFALYFVVDHYRHDDSRDIRHRRRLAYRRLRKKLHSCSADAFFEAWLDFLGDKLGLPARAITRADVLATLSGQPEAHELGREVAEIFRQGEAALYGGMGHVLEKERLLRVAKKLAEVL